MQNGLRMRIEISLISSQIEKKELVKLAAWVFYCLSKFLSIWFETINEADTLKIKKKGVSSNVEYFLI